MSVETLSAAPETPRVGDPIICSCLHITERQLRATLARSEITTITALRKTIGAGDGCTACHHVLKHFLKAHNSDHANKP